MQFDVNAQTIIKTHFEIDKIVDGDGLIVRNIISNDKVEVRFYGIDAPELSPCKKLKQDELETHLAGSFLIKLGFLSYEYLMSKAQVGTPVTLIQEVENKKDKYGRTLAYVILPNGKCLNEIMVKNGYAKPYDKIYCAELPKYQQLNLKAKKSKKGLYSYSNW
ncbi:thermonuclease family protein [Mangrovibacterium sp.]|uniref:thermonuclease family protein n=1 Tax=Mangrovibacterium sp. TaxID=1961364 RepID=UPI003566BEF8